MLAIHNTQDWPAEKLLPYGPQITAAMHRLVKRFPRDVSLEGLAADIIHGRQQLWLILDGDEFRSFVLTEIKVNDATGVRSVVVTSMAGDDGVPSVPLIAQIEDWARGAGADEVRVLGRTGWKRALGAQGYAMDAALFRKDLN